jgi:hypothetical protein
LFGAPKPPATDGTPLPDDDDPAALGTVIQRSVELAYRVVDDYLQQGQRAAERIAGRSYGPDAWVTDAQDVSARFARYASDAMGLWLDALDGVRDGRTPAPAPAPSGAATNGAVPPSPPTSGSWLVIEVQATQSAAVTLDLRAGVAAGTVVVHALRDVEVEKPPLRDVVVEPAVGDGPVRVCVRVPAGQPAGTYHGLIVDDETNRPVGSVSVRLLDA